MALPGVDQRGIPKTKQKPNRGAVARLRSARPPTPPPRARLAVKSQPRGRRRGKVQHNLPRNWLKLAAGPGRAGERSGAERREDGGAVRGGLGPGADAGRRRLRGGAAGREPPHGGSRGREDRGHEAGGRLPGEHQEGDLHQQDAQPRERRQVLRAPAGGRHAVPLPRVLQRRRALRPHRARRRHARGRGAALLPAAHRRRGLPARHRHHPPRHQTRKPAAGRERHPQNLRFRPGHRLQAQRPRAAPQQDVRHPALRGPRAAEARRVSRRARRRLGLRHRAHGDAGRRAALGPAQRRVPGVQRLEGEEDLPAAVEEDRLGAAGPAAQAAGGEPRGQDRRGRHREGPLVQPAGRPRRQAAAGRPPPRLAGRLPQPAQPGQDEVLHVAARARHRRPPRRRRPPPRARAGHQLLAAGAPRAHAAQQPAPGHAGLLPEPVAAPGEANDPVLHQAGRRLLLQGPPGGLREDGLRLEEELHEPGHHLDHRPEEQQADLQGEPGGDGEQDPGGLPPLQGRRLGVQAAFPEDQGQAQRHRQHAESVAAPELSRPPRGSCLLLLLLLLLLAGRNALSRASRRRGGPRGRTLPFFVPPPPSFPSFGLSRGSGTAA